MTPKGTVIITGASKGIGLALAREFLAHHFVVHTISRSRPPIDDRNLKHHFFDFSEAGNLAGFFMELLQSLPLSDLGTVILINNAGVINPMYPVGLELDSAAIQAHYQINLITPTLLSACFIKRFQKYNGKKIIIQIGSGAADGRYAGWAHYSASKSGLRQFHRTVSSEQQSQKFPVVSILFNPGRTDTAMQEQIRSAKETYFPQKDAFVQAYNNGILNKPEILAGKLVQQVITDKLNQGDEISHTDLLS